MQLIYLRLEEECESSKNYQFISVKNNKLVNSAMKQEKSDF